MLIRRLVKHAVLVLAPIGLAIAMTFAVAVADAVAGSWRPPVQGAVTRAFDPGRNPFEGGRHRGVDLAAPPGSAVRAPCAGRVAFAGAVGTNGRVVTLRCEGWRVTHLPLATIAVRTGTTVTSGDLLGTVAGSPVHHGLHLGVRREGVRFGYTDPLGFLAAQPAPPPPLGPGPKPARRPPIRPPRPPAARSSPPRPVRAPPAVRRPALRLITPRENTSLTDSSQRDSNRETSNRAPRAPFAPWPAWLGLALVLGGAGLRLRGRLPAIRGRATAPVR